MSHEGRPWPRSGPGVGISLLVFLASAVYLQSFAAYGFNIRDEWVVPHGAIRVLGGEVPWKDFQGYAPGPYYLHALAFRLFGPHLSVARTLAVLLTAVMVVLVIQACTRLMSRPFAWLAGFLLLLAPGVYYGRYINFFSLLCILTFFRALGGRGGDVVLLGIVTGLTTLFRQDLGLLVLGAGAFCLLIGPSRPSPPGLRERAAPLLPFLAGAALVFLPWGIYYWAHSRLGYILRFHWNALAGGYQRMSLPYPGLGELLVDGRWGEAVVFYGPPLVLLTAIGVLLQRYWSRRDDTNTLRVLFVTLVAGGMFHQAFWRTSMENHVKVIAPILVLACLLLWLGARALRRLGVDHPRLWPLAILGGLVLLALPALYVREALFSPVRFYVGAPSVLRDELVELKLPGGSVYAPPYWAAPTEQAARYIRAHTSPGEPIFVIPFAPMLYVLTDRPNPSYFEWVLPAEPAVYPDLEPRILADLERARPRYVVFEDFPLDRREDRRFRHYAPALARYITDRYRLEAKFEDHEVYYQILRRRDGPVP